MGMTEGTLHKRRAFQRAPSTTLRVVPLPVPGRIFLNVDIAWRGR